MNNTKVVFIGGPCGGKTVASSEFKNRLKNYKVCLINETAGNLLNLGYFDEIKISLFDFQNMLFKIQFINEYNAEKKCNMILCDRGLLDSLAYLSEEEFKKILFQNEVELDKIISTYDIALYFKTIAYEYHEKFRELRIYETPESAIARDIKALKIWKSILLNIKYSNYDGMDNKINVVYNEFIKHLSKMNENNKSNLSDYYDSKYLIKMYEDIEKILFNNKVSQDAKRKTLELIK